MRQQRNINISAYVGRTVEFTAFVKTHDKLIRLGLDGAEPKLLLEKESETDWTKCTMIVTLPEEMKSAEIYLETDGNADFYVDDIIVRPMR